MQRSNYTEYLNVDCIINDDTVPLLVLSPHQILYGLSNAIA